MRKNFYTVREFHEILGNTTCITSIYNQIKAGKIPVTYIGTRTLIPAYWVNDFCKMYRCAVDLEDNNG